METKIKMSVEERKAKLQPYILSHVDDSPAVYCGTYYKYNNGSLAGAWLNLEAFDSYEEFLEICALLHDDENPEFMFQDFQGFPTSLYCESGFIEEGFNDIITYCHTSKDEREAFDAYCEYISDVSFSDAMERYMGQFDSKEDFAEHYVSDVYDLERMMGELSFYFYYKRLARDLFVSDYIFCDGYVFCRR